MYSNKKMRVAALSVASNTILIILKVIAGALSGSVSIISEAIHSGMDLIAAIIAFFSVRMSAEPPDREHPYGHGKIENVSGVAEGILIFIAAFLIIKEAVLKIMEPHDINQATIAVLVMTISGVVNYFVSKKIYEVAKETDSVALEADALHLRTDVYTSFGVAIGILLIKLSQILITDPVIASKFFILDPIVAILVALLILKEAWVLCYNAFNPLLDARLSDEEEEKIKHIICKYQNKIIDFHQLRTRKSGNIKYIDFHMTVNKDFTVEQSHELCEIIENDLEEEVKNTNINIHIEPGNMTTVGICNSILKEKEMEEEMKEFAFVSDFDGTLSNKDFYHIIIDKYMGQEGRDFYNNWKKTKKINVEFLNKIFSSIGKSEEEIKKDILDIPLDEHSINFINSVQKSGGDFYVLSAGTSYYIKILFEELGIKNVTVISMDGIYENGGIKIVPDKESPYYSDVFGVDKGKVIKELKEKYNKVYFAGDSEPDVSAANNADLTFALGELKTFLKKEECSFMEIETFKDIQAYFDEKGLLG